MFYMTKEETEFLMQSNAIEGVYDSASYHQAKHAWNYLLEEKELTTGVILKTHKLLMLNQPILGYQRGYFRTEQVWVGGREGLAHYKIRGAVEHWAMNVEDLIKNAKNEPDIFKERMTKEHHVEYEKIHPFIDGNGRTGRMFLNWERLKIGLPLLVIKEAEKQAYYDWFKD